MTEMEEDAETTSISRWLGLKNDKDEVDLGLEMVGPGTSEEPTSKLRQMELSFGMILEEKVVPQDTSAVVVSIILPMRGFIVANMTACRVEKVSAIGESLGNRRDL